MAIVIIDVQVTVVAGVIARFRHISGLSYI